MTSSASQRCGKKDAAQVEADKASLEQAKADFETNISPPGRTLKGRRPRVSRCRDRLGLLPDVRADRRPDRLPRSSSATSWGGDRGRSTDYTELAVIRQLDPMGVDIQVASRYLDRVTRLIVKGSPSNVPPRAQGRGGPHVPG